MAVLMILEWQDVTTSDYERVNETIGIRGDADAPDGWSSTSPRSPRTTRW
jgi:hypothetical protein